MRPASCQAKAEGDEQRGVPERVRDRESMTRGGCEDGGPTPRTLWLVLPILFLFVLGGCNDDFSFPGMGSPDLELPSGIPPEQLPAPESRGARLLADYCSQCHGIPSPRRHSAEDWEASARRMFRRMDHMEHMGGGMMGRMHGRRGDVRSPTAYERRAILAYLRDHAMASAEGEALPVGEGRERFRTVCTRCHALPDPDQHTAEEWPAVVQRMRENMREMEVAEPSDEEAAAIVRYLQRAAAGSRDGRGR